MFLVNQLVQNTIFKFAYRTLRLDEVSKAVLSDDTEGSGGVNVTGKYRGLTGKDIQSLPVEEQKKELLSIYYLFSYLYLITLEE